MKFRNVLGLVLLSCAPIAAQANILSDQFIKRELVESATSATPENANEHLYARMLSSTGAAKAIFAVWSEYDDQSVIGARWGEVGLNLLRWSDPERLQDWKTSRRIQGIPQMVYQQDGLVDLERVSYSHGGYPTKSISGYTIADTSRPIRGTPKTSERLLAEGFAPIGPDNKPITACRIGLSSQAPYVEMSELQRTKFSKNTGMAFASCLSGNVAKSYWKARYSDFVDKYHDRLPLDPGGDKK